MRLAVGLALLLSCACADDPQGGVGAIPAEWPRPVYETARIEVGGHPVEVEIADTSERRRYGYMFIATPPRDDQGMLFVYPEPLPLSFWMRNTRIPLDIVFFDETGRILNAHRRMEPLDETRLRYAAVAPCRYALELRGGWLDDHEVWLADRIELPPEVRAIRGDPNDEQMTDVPRLVHAPR